MKIILITLFISLFLCSCGEFLSLKRTSNICDTSSLFNGHNILFGCSIDHKFYEKVPESDSSVYLNIENKMFSSQSCSGNFISENIIITAAHCFYKSSNNLKIKVTHKNHKGTWKSVLKPRSHTIHYFYSNLNSKIKRSNRLNISHFGDLALIYFEEGAKTVNAKPVRLTNYVYDNEKSLLVGYGSINDNQKESTNPEKKWGIAYVTEENNLSQLSLSIEPENFKDPSILNIQKKQTINFQEFFNLLSLYNVISKQYSYGAVHKSMINLYGLENENGLCNGDSGSLIFYKRGNEYAGGGIAHMLAGKCKDKISINTRIGAYRDWIVTESENLYKIYDSNKNRQRPEFID